MHADQQDVGVNCIMLRWGMMRPTTPFASYTDAQIMYYELTYRPTLNWSRTNRWPVSTASSKADGAKRNLEGLRADQQDVRVRMNLRWGVMPFRLDFSPEPEQNIQRTFQLLQRRSLVASGDLVVVVSGTAQVGLLYKTRLPILQKGRWPGCRKTGSFPWTPNPQEV